MAAFRPFLLLLCAACAWGSGTVYTFEPPTFAGSSPGAGGVALSGQDGWLTGGGLASGIVYTYAGTPIPAIPGGSGGSQFVAMRPGSENYVDGVSFAGPSEWVITFDILVYSVTVGNNSVGSFYLFADSTGYQLHAFPAVAAGGTWSAKFDVFNPNGTQNNGVDLGGAFDGLPMDHWYQEQIAISTTSNQILSVSIEDPSNPAANATDDPTGWYLYGGASAAFSVGGMGLRGIGTLGFDNISLDPTPEPASWTLWLAGAAALCFLRGRRR
jgi:hypothetical protein